MIDSQQKKIFTQKQEMDILLKKLEAMQRNYETLSNSSLRNHLL